MKRKKIYLGDTFLEHIEAQVDGGFVEMDGERFYKISNYHLMPDFFMTIVSDSDHWNYISSNGSLSAGRKNRDNALFPYYTDDKIHDYHGITGSRTVVLVDASLRSYLWEPFAKGQEKIYKIERNIYKNIYGNKLVFEEVNDDLEVAFRYAWYSSEKYGFVRKSTIVNRGNQSTKISILDGIQNILPSGIDYAFQNEYSNLSNAYKKSELLESSGLGLYMLSSIPVDRAEPSESLIATTVWSRGLANQKVLISSKQVEAFCQGLLIKEEVDVRASRGAFFVHAELLLSADKFQDWMMVAEINQTSVDVANLEQFLQSPVDHSKLVNDDIETGTQNLIKIVASADGLQASQASLNPARHFSNTLFNVMRGGIYLDNYKVTANDFRKYVKQINLRVFADQKVLLESLPSELSIGELMTLAQQSGSTDFIRICYEYLPLTFSRRHGDPSRPWNQFSIDTKNEDGSPKSDYQGNWRDIFQNWEALSLSYPGYIENIISKFLNATTGDGYNPYRIMRSGIDWEAPDPDDPWAYIGYWGDHQIIYLQKLLELSQAYHPGKLEELLTQKNFAYANVPYRIKSYKHIVANPQDTIDFDFDLNEKISSLVEEIGADGRLLHDKEGKVLYANLTEKILVTLLAKLSNFIPEAGIWLNTQRPEWNDANNALVGNGVSMVTLYYLRRFVKFWEGLFAEMGSTTLQVSEEIKELYDSINKLFVSKIELLDAGFSDEDRRNFADVLGIEGETYRKATYRGLSGVTDVINTKDLTDFATLTLKYIDQSIRANKRSDGLYHAYNLISFTKKGIKIRHLYPMLEGQVSVLSAGLLSDEESLAVLDSLKGSDLFREDQYSYLLYPDRELTRFTDKNNIPAQAMSNSRLLSKLVVNGDTSIIGVDDAGGYHFNGTFRNAAILKDAILNLDETKYGAITKKEIKEVLEVYEQLFDHQSFTGRSGTFYGYEGLGSIYWHMVSKLLLATEECFFQAVDNHASAKIIGRIKDHYYEIKAGIGLNKSPELYGAFPTDAYSHTPGHAGAQQPGMTGQVKEDVIARMGELGVRVDGGKINFNLSLVDTKEFLRDESMFEYFDVSGRPQQIQLRINQLAFTLCQVPVVYTLNNKTKIEIDYSDGKTESIDGNVLSQEIGQSIFDRTGEIQVINVAIKH